MINSGTIGDINRSFYFRFGEILTRIGGDINVDVCKYCQVRSILIWTSPGVAFGTPVYWEEKDRKNMRKIGETGDIDRSLYFQFGAYRIRTDCGKNIEDCKYCLCGIF